MTLMRSVSSWVRRRARASEAVLIGLAVVVGGVAGLLSVVQGAIARTLQHWLFALPNGGRLSAADHLAPLPLLALAAGQAVVDPQNAALVGMAALAVAVVGGPMTMAMLVLEATHDVPLAAASLAAVLVASTIVRETFGYSFSTWRLHLRGETIKSARDVGWMRTLTAGRMMRRVERATPAEISVAEFRRAFPLGSTSRVVLADSDDRYAGIVQTARAYGEEAAVDAPIGSLAIHRDLALPPDADIKAVMAAFDAAGADELAVVGEDARVLGILSEPYVRRRYAEELDKAQRELFGED